MSGEGFRLHVGRVVEWAACARFAASSQRHAQAGCSINDQPKLARFTYITARSTSRRTHGAEFDRRIQHGFTTLAFNSAPTSSAVGEPSLCPFRLLLRTNKCGGVLCVAYCTYTVNTFTRFTRVQIEHYYINLKLFEPYRTLLIFSNYYV